MKKFTTIVFIFINVLVNAQGYEGKLAAGFKSYQRITGSDYIEPLEAESFAKTAAGTPTGSSDQVGITPGELSVSLTGGATYTIPIAVPPGIGGVKPEIALNYNSQQNGGLAGYCWNVIGLSSIKRIPSTKFHDGTIDPVDGDALDRYSLDGQRLISKSGIYGQDGTTYETENYSNIKVTSIGLNFGLPLYFKVEYPDGSFAMYGNTSDSKGYGSYEYAISYWQNAQGVRISYTYEGFMSMLRISSIKYGTTYDSPGINEIKFTYAPKKRKEEASILYMIVDALNIKTITVNGNTGLYRKYDLTYLENATLGYERLERVTESSGMATLNPTVFTYNTTNDAIVYSSLQTDLTVGNINVANSSTISGDFNGDGKLDFILYPNAKNEYWLFNDITNSSNLQTDYHHAINFETIFPISYLGLIGSNTTNYKMMPNHGWCIVEKAGNVTNFKNFYWDPTGIYSIFNYNRSYTFPKHNNLEIPKAYLSGDFNGDGLTDAIVLQLNDGGATASQAGKTYFLNLDRRITSNYVNSSGTVTITSASKIMVNDVNGDGKSDLMVFDNHSLKVYTLNDNNQLIQILNYLHTSIITTTAILLGDYNGDGKTDFIIPSAPNSSVYRVFTCEDNYYNLESQTFTSFPFPVQDDSNSNYIIASDYNNDGKTDLLKLNFNRAPGATTGKASLTCYINFRKDEGAYFSGQSGRYFTTTSPSSASINRDAQPFFRTPEKQNGNLQIGFIKDNKISSFISSRDWNKDKLLKTITTGNGVTETISYKPLLEESTNGYSNPNIYYPELGLTENYPNMDVKKAPTYNVVAKIEQQSNDSYKKQFFTYQGAVLNLNGIGFLGFRKVLRTNWIDEGTHQMISNISQYDISLRGANSENFSVFNLWPLSNATPSSSYITKTTKVYNTDSNGTVSPALQANLVFKLQNTKTESIDKITNTSAVTTSIYDSYNNPTQVTNTVKNNTTVEEVTVGVNAFENSVSGPLYYIGRPTSKTTTTTIYPAQANQDVNTFEESYSYTNHLLSQLKRKSNGSNYITEDYVYEPGYANLTKKTISVTGGPVPREISYEYDPTHRFVTKSYDVLQAPTEYTNDPNTGSLLTVKDQYQNTTTYHYDEWNRKNWSIDYLGKREDYYYTRDGEKSLMSANSESGLASTMLFDDLGRKVRVGARNISGVWSYISYKYDIYDRNYKTSEPYFTNPEKWNETEYDNYGRTTKVTDYTTKFTTFSYTNLTSVASENGKVKTSVKDAIGNTISVTDSPGGEIVYKYFANGNLKSTTYGGITTTIEQDEWGRKKKLIDPSAGEYKYDYNQFGELTLETKPSPKGTIAYDIDNFGRISKITEAGDYTNTVATNVYEPASTLLTSKHYEDNNAITTSDYSYTYDQYKRLSIANENTYYAFFQRAFSYDDFGRASREKHTAVDVLSGNRSDKWIKHTYLNGRHWQIVDDANDEMLWQIDAVNEKEQILTAQYGSATGIETHTYEDGFPKTSNFRTQNGTYASSTPFMTLKNTFDLVKGNLTGRKTTLGTSPEMVEVFEYDVQDRLTKYPNAAGVNITQSYMEDGRIENNDVGNYRYETTAKPYQNTTIKFSDPLMMLYYKDRTPQTITYNSFKCPVSISEQNKEKIDFEYNAFHQRAVMFYGGLQTDKKLRPLRKIYSSDGTMEIITDNTNPSLPLTHFVTYIGGDAYSAPLILKNRGNNLSQSYYFLHRDYLGSILAITNPNGQIVEKRTFDAWGQLTSLQNGNNVNLTKFAILDRGYTGHEHLLNVGIINMNGRLYDPKIHRFLSPDNNIQDPSNTQNYNRYGYVFNNPLRYTDPTGETGEEWGNNNGYNNGYNNGEGLTSGQQTIIGGAISSIATTLSDPGVKEWLGRNFNIKSWGNWFTDNLKDIGKRWFGINKKAPPPPPPPIYPAATYSFVPTGNGGASVSTRSVSPMIGYNNSVEMHTYVYDNERLKEYSKLSRFEKLFASNPRVIGGGGMLEFVSGAGEMKFVQYSGEALMSLKGTELAAQSEAAIANIMSKMKAGDMSIYSRPIYTYLYKGERYILNGHHRIQAAIRSGTTIEAIELSGMKLYSEFGKTMKEIWAGLHF